MRAPGRAVPRGRVILIVARAVWGMTGIGLLGVVEREVTRDEKACEGECVGFDFRIGSEVDSPFGFGGGWAGFSVESGAVDVVVWVS